MTDGRSQLSPSSRSPPRRYRGRRARRTGGDRCPRPPRDRPPGGRVAGGCDDRTPGHARGPRARSARRPARPARPLRDGSRSGSAGDARAAGGAVQSSRSRAWSRADHGRRARGSDAPDRPLRPDRVQHLRSPRPRLGGGAALAVTLERFALRGGAVTIEDRTLAPAHAWRVEAATLEVRGVSTLPEAPPGVVTLGAVAAGSPISLWLGGVRLAPLRFHATVIAREIDASLAALYLPPGSPLSPARGKLDVSATIEQQAAAGLRVSLDAVFSDVELRRSGRQPAFLSAPAVRVKVENLRLRGGAVELERLAVDGGSALLEDGGLAPVHRWQAKGIALEARTLSSARDAPAGVATARAVVAGSPVP